jgi:hypothetical protein
LSSKEDGCKPLLPGLELRDFMRNAILMRNVWPNTLSVALQFYEKDKVMHFVFKQGCASNTW